MPEAKTLKPKNIKETESEKYQQSLLPEVFIISELKTDRKLPLIRFHNFTELEKANQNNIDLSVELPAVEKNVDLFLFVDNEKRDMYYQVKSGIYTFKNIRLKRGENLIELFYRIGVKRSSSVYSIIIRE